MHFHYTEFMARIFKICVSFICAVLGLVFSGCGKSSAVWYVQSGYEQAWNTILLAAPPPYAFKSVQVWDETIKPSKAGIWITTEPWEKQGRVAVYPQLSSEREYQGATVLALDPWMVFRKHINPGLTLERAISSAGGEGLLLISGKDPLWVQAWVSRLVQARPGEFPADDKVWQETEDNLFRGRRFPPGSQSYNWQDVLFRLMGNEHAWVYAPLSAIRSYENPQKSILEATAFPSSANYRQYSLHAHKILWAIPLGSEKKLEKLAEILDWLKKPETQTVIANTLGWIPADPYGSPYDPVSSASQRNWLTSTYIYTVNAQENTE